MGILIWVTAALCVAAVFVYGRLGAEAAAANRFALLVLASLLFILLGVLCIGEADVAPFYPLLVMAGLLLGFLADIALGIRELLPERGEACMLISMCAYTLGHLFYIVLFTCIVSVGIVALGVAAALFAAAILFRKRAGLAPGALAMPLMVYIGVVCVLLGFAVHILVYDMRMQTCVLALGAGMLAFSSAAKCVGIYGRGAGYAGVNAYYAGQVLFAVSMVFV